MKIIEAMKKVKANAIKLADLRRKIETNCANMANEKPAYDNIGKLVKSWLQTCNDISQENVRLLVAIQRTNLATNVTIELGGKQVNKTIAEWVWRRRQYVDEDLRTISCLGDRGLRTEVTHNNVTGEDTLIHIMRHFDIEKRDERISVLHEEPSLIDGTLEITNAITDLIEE